MANVTNEGVREAGAVVGEPASTDTLSAASSSPGRRWSLASTDTGVVMAALSAWLLTRLALWWVSIQASWLVGDGAPPGQLSRWDRWDVRVFRFIAQYGYDGPPNEPGHYGAFFPGLPLMERLVGIAVPDPVAAGLLISLVAGGVACVSLACLTADEFGPVAGRWAAWAFCLFPMTVFVGAGYSEALFTGFAFPAVLLARRGHWAGASLLAAGATATRIAGFFLLIALGVEFLMQVFRQPRAGRLPSPRAFLPGAWLVPAALPGLAFFWYLHERTGDWNAYMHIEENGWGRSHIGVLPTWRLMWNAATTVNGGVPSFTFGYRLEIVAMVVGLVLAVVLLVRRRWSEMIFVAAPTLALASASSYLSEARTAITWWPLFAGLGALSKRPRWGRWVAGGYAVLAVPSMILIAAAFTTGRWAG